MEIKSVENEVGMLELSTAMTIFSSYRGSEEVDYCHNMEQV